MKSAGVILACCVLLVGLIVMLYFRPSASPSSPSRIDLEARNDREVTTASSTANPPETEVRTLAEGSGLTDVRRESLQFEDSIHDAAEGDGLLDQVRPVAEYEAMSADELDDEWYRLSRLLTEETTRRGSELADRGFMIYLGPSPAELSPASIPEEYKDMLTCFHSEVGVDGLYLVVLDPAVDADLYELRDACSLVATLKHQKRIHDQ